MVMSMMDHVPLAQVKNQLSQVVERVEREHGRVVITKHGRPAAVLISIEDLESLEETLAVMSDPQLMASIREADADPDGGEVLTKEEALARFTERP